MATLKEIISEIFNSEFGEVEDQTAGATTDPERVAESNESPKDPEPNEPEMSEEDIRKYIREELNQLYNEAKQAKARTTATMTVSNVVEPERTADDILADRFKALMGSTNEQKES